MKETEHYPLLHEIRVLSSVGMRGTRERQSKKDTVIVRGNYDPIQKKFTSRIPYFRVFRV